MTSDQKQDDLAPHISRHKIDPEAITAAAAELKASEKQGWSERRDEVFEMLYQTIHNPPFTIEERNKTSLKLSVSFEELLQEKREAVLEEVKLILETANLVTEEGLKALKSK